MGGRNVPAGTWQFTFDRGGDPVIGRVDLPDGRRLEWQHHAVTGASGTTYWTLVRNALSRYGVDVSHIDYTYTTCSDPSVPMISQYTTSQDGRSFSTAYSYHASYIENCDFHRPYQVTQTGELSRTTTQSFTYPSGLYRGDLVGSTVSTIGGDSYQADYTYNGQGFLTAVQALGVQSTMAPDSAGNVASITDPNGHTTSFTYQWGVPKDTQTPLYTISRSINPEGTVASVTRRGFATTFTYDALGRVTSVTAPGRAAVSTTYNTDTVVSIQGTSAVTSLIDGFGRTTAVVDNAGLSQWLQFDALGQVILQSYPSDASTWAADGYAYDDLGRLMTVSHSGGGAVQIAHTGANVTVTDENGHATTQHWASFSPSDGRLLSVTDPAGQIWQYAYNGLGSLTSVTQPGGSVRTFTYNTRNQLISETHPESGTTSYTYDDAGNVIQRVDANGTALTFVYDANNRLVGVQGVGGDSVANTYDESNNRTTLANGAASTTFGYDSADRLTTRTDAIAGHVFTSTYQYDSLDQLVGITYPSGRTISYDYDAASRVTRVYDATTTYASGIAYHPSGAVASLTFGNGTTESTTFDGRYRPVTHMSGPLSLTYAYDLAGNVTQITDARPSYTASFGYDTLDRLTSVGGWMPNGFTYDALGNRLTESNGAVTSTYDAHLRLVQANGTFGSSSFTYDAAGNLKTESGASYDYTPYNMLRAATVSGIQSSFAYDGDNQRILRSGATGVTYTIRGPGGVVLAEYADAGSTTSAGFIREYVYLGGRRIAAIGRSPASAAPPVSVSLTSPTNGAVITAGAPVTLTAQPYVAGGSISRVEFYASGNYLGAAYSAPYSLPVTLAAGPWNLQARVLPVAGGVAVSANVPITVVVGNAPPTVSLTAPNNNAVLGTGRTVTLTATASDSDGIAKVEFYRGSLLLGTDTTAPYSFDWTNLQDGAYTLSAKAYDVLGATTNSAPVSVTVQSVATITVSPASPTAGTPALVTVDGSAACSSVNVYFGDGNMQTFMGSSLPTSNAYAWATGGPKTLTAVGLGGACDSQASANISVLTPPSVAMTAPTSGSSYLAPATIALTASASAAQGAITRVDFYANGSLVGSSVSPPYGVTWTNVPQGSYSVTAVATDTYGATATSSSITVIVGTPPPSTVLAVSVTPNPVGAGVWATVTVTGTNPCGMLYMDFGDGNWWISPINDLPFSTTHAWAGPGSYTVTAAGYYVCGGQATATVTVTSPPSPDPASLSIEDVIGGPSASAMASDADAPKTTGEPATSMERAAEPIPPAEASSTDVTVLVDLNGTGAGTVTGPLMCHGQATGCAATVPVGTQVTFTATPDTGVSWMGWSGACSGVASSCTITASDHLLVVANFWTPVTKLVYYYHLDELGSVRAVTDSAGAVVEQHDYRPFGEDNQPLPTEGADPARFLGQERDQTKLDVFGARYYSMFRGRFNTVDPGHADASLLAPQSWNGYAYARNNPFGFADPSGLGYAGECRKGAFCDGVNQPLAVPLISAGGSSPFGDPALDCSSGASLIPAMGAGGVFGNCDSIDGTGDGSGSNPGFGPPGQGPAPPVPPPPPPPPPGPPGPPPKPPSPCSTDNRGSGYAVSDFVTGMGDAFLLPIVLRNTFDLNWGIDFSSTAYKVGQIAGTIVGLLPAPLEGAAALANASKAGGAFKVLNSNRYFRIGEGAWKGSMVDARISSPYLAPFLPAASNGHILVANKLPAWFIPALGKLGRPSGGCAPK